MARFYFDICNRGEKISDMVGVECDTLGGAFQQAKLIISNVRNAYGIASLDWSSWVLEVRYWDRSELFNLPFTLAGIST